MGQRMKERLEKAEQLKQAIIESAYKLFLARGYEKVTLSDIERLSGATRGDLLYHYRSKDEVLLATAERYAADFLCDAGPSEESLNSQTPLKAYLVEYARRIASKTSYFREVVVKDSDITPASSLNFMIHVSALCPPFKYRLQEYASAQARYGVEIVNRAKERGEIRPELDTERLVGTFIHIFAGILFFSALTHQTMALDKLQNEWELFYQTVAVK